MRSRPLATFGVPLVIAALALTGCGSRSDSSSPNTGATGGSTGGSMKTAKIGVISPLSGDLSALGLGIKNSVDLAIKNANDQNMVKGWKFELDAQDDTATPATGQAAATKLASDSSVIGVVGTLNSSVAQSVQPVLDRANILMVSPANTNPSLTQGADWETSKKRQFDSYFRTATTDAVQGPFAADYAYNTLGLKSVATVNDKLTYGVGLTATFTQEFKKLGGTVVATDSVTQGDKDFSATISRLQPSKPAFIYYGGQYPEASLLSAQAKAKGLAVPLMGGDGIYDDTFIKTAGASAAEGDLATSVGAPTASLPSAQQFVTDYKAAGYSNEYGAYGAYAYDAAMAIIQAAAKVLPTASSIDSSTLQKMVQAEGSVTFQGATGQVAFDQYGDSTNKTLTVYQVKNGEWAPVKTGTFGG